MKLEDHPFLANGVCVIIGFIIYIAVKELVKFLWGLRTYSKVKLSCYMPWRHMGGEEV
jgi:hypothetical protein